MTAGVPLAKVVGILRACLAHARRARTRELGNYFGFTILAVLLIGLCEARSARAGDSGAVSPLVCRIGVNVEDLYDLDMARDSFGAILWIWTLCPSAEVDPLATLAFATAAGGLVIEDGVIVPLLAAGEAPPAPAGRSSTPASTSCCRG